MESLDGPGAAAEAQWMRSVILDLLRNADSAAAASPASSARGNRGTQNWQEAESFADGQSGDDVSELDPADLDDLIGAEVFGVLPL